MRNLARGGYTSVYLEEAEAARKKQANLQLQIERNTRKW
jgi:hypothetical protein